MTWLTKISKTFFFLASLITAGGAASAQAQHLRIFYNNDNMGELVSCACRNRLGGLAKKAGCMLSLQEQSSRTATLFLDAGNQLFHAPSLPKKSQSAACIRAKGILAANRQMGLTFAGVGEYDLAAGPDFLQKIGGRDFTWLSLNVVDPANGKPLFQGLSSARVGGLTVAVLGLTAENATSEAFRVKPWREVLPAWVEQARAKADIIILLSNYPLSENRKIAAACPGIDLIFQAGYAIGNLQPVAVGNTLINQTDIRGRYLGLLEINWRGHGPWQFLGRGALAQDDAPASTFDQRFIPLNAAIPDDKKTAEITSQFEERAKAAGTESSAGN